jgi:hypothetical protein
MGQLIDTFDRRDGSTEAAAKTINRHTALVRNGNKQS